MKYQYKLMTMLAGGLLLASTGVRAQTWSSAASVCQPGSDSVGLYSFSSATFQFGGSNTGQIRTRCAVVNPLDTGDPKWTTLSMGYVDPDGTGIDYQVDAQLARVNKQTGAAAIIKTLDSSSFSSTGPAIHSITFTHTFDFSNYAYYISLTLTRGDTAQNPGVWYVQLR